MRNKIFFFSLAAVAIVLILYCAVAGGMETRKMNEYNSQKASIVEAPPKNIQGLLYYNKLTSAEQYVYEKISEGLEELDEYTPKMAFVPTESELKNAVDALMLDRPDIFYIDPDGFGMQELTVWHTEAETEPPPPQTEPVQTEPAETEFEEQTEDNGPPDIPVITDPPESETEPVTEAETEEQTAEVIQQVIDGLYAKLKIPYIYSLDDTEIMIKRLSASLAKADVVSADCKNEFEMALALHDYLTDVSKTGVSTELCDTAYGALVEGSADGHGYALAYKLLLSRKGIVSYVAYGTYKGIDSAWNVALLEDKYYNIDAYASDPDMIIDGQLTEDVFTHAYFCVNDEFILSTHVLNDDCQVPKCTEPYNYYDIFSLNAQNQTMLENIADRLIAECEDSELFEICVTYTYDTGKILETVKTRAEEYYFGQVDVMMYVPIQGVQSYLFRVEYIPPEIPITLPTPDDTTETDEE